MSEKISVIMPVYRCRAYLEKAIGSILSQSVSELEIIAVEDCSGDGTRELLQTLAANEPRIRVILNEQNMGVAAVRNRALDAVSGDYVTFCDSDDIIPEGAYAALLRAVKGNDISMGGFEDVYCERGEEVRREKQKIDPHAKNSTFYSIFSVWSVCCKLYRTDFLRRNNMRFREDMRVGEDVVFLAELAALEPKCALIDQTVYHYYHYQNENYRSLTHVYDLEVFRQHIECRYLMMDICKHVPTCRDYVYLSSTGYIERRLHLLPYGEARQAGFALFCDYVKGYDFAKRPQFFKAITGVDLQTFLQLDADRYFELQDEVAPRERVAAEFDSGLIGLRWVIRYFTGWLRFKLKRNSNQR